MGLLALMEDGNTFNVADELITLHAHLNQQGMADVVGAGQSLESSGRLPIATFHRELIGSPPDIQTVETRLEPPDNLRDLLDHALVTLQAPAIRLTAQRRRNHQGSKTRQSAFCIIEAMERKAPQKLIKYPMTLWMEEHAPAAHRAFSRYGKPAETMLLRVGQIPAASIAGGTVVEVLQHLSAVVFQEKTDLNLDLREVLPPKKWVPQGILGLEAKSRK